MCEDESGEFQKPVLSKEGIIMMFKNDVLQVFKILETTKNGFICFMGLSNDMIALNWWTGEEYIKIVKYFINLWEPQVL